MRTLVIFFLHFMLFSTQCFSGEKEEFKEKLSVFREHLQIASYNICDDEMIMETEFIETVQKLANQHGVTPNLLPVIGELADEFKEQKDLVSLWLLAAITSPYLSKRLLTELRIQMCRLMLGVVRVTGSCQGPECLFQEIISDISREVSDESVSVFVNESHAFIVTELNPYLQMIGDTARAQNTTVSPLQTTPVQVPLGASVQAPHSS